MRFASFLLATATFVLEPPPGMAQEAGDADPFDQTIAGTVLRRTIAPDIDPYAALGIRAGGYILYPSLAATVGYTSNASGTGGGSGSGYQAVSAELAIRSDWAAHEATLTLRGSSRRFFDGATADEPSGSAEATGRIDLNDGWTTAVEGGLCVRKTGDLRSGFSGRRRGPAGSAPPHRIDVSKRWRWSHRRATGRQDRPDDL